MPRKDFFFPSCANCGKSHQRECRAGKEGCYKCGDMGHKHWSCPIANRLGREEKLKEVLIEEGVFLDGVMVPNDNEPMSTKACDGTSSGM